MNDVFKDMGVREERRTCDDHGDYTAKITSMLGKEHVSRCPKCAVIRDAEIKKKEDERIEDERRALIARLFKDAAIPKRFKDKSFDDYVASSEGERGALNICKAYAESFEQREEAGGGMALCGKPGTGKTHLALAIANTIIREFNKTVVFSSVMSAMRRVKSTYSKDSDEKENEAVKAYTQPDMLILDEVGVQFGSDAEKMILFEIINIRYLDMKPTILISNLSISDLEDYIGVRVVDRMREGGGAVIAFDWESYRSKL
ncbi:MAG: ATP-binding protein [Gammaproteobacteria bacterium]|nr:ATP-binding protein [Gammaproteobacteria bacterium]